MKSNGLRTSLKTKEQAFESLLKYALGDLGAKDFLQHFDNFIKKL